MAKHDAKRRLASESPRLPPFRHAINSYFATRTHTHTHTHAPCTQIVLGKCILSSNCAVACTQFAAHFAAKLLLSLSIVHTYIPASIASRGKTVAWHVLVTRLFQIPFVSTERPPGCMHARYKTTHLGQHVAEQMALSNHSQQVA